MKNAFVVVSLSAVAITVAACSQPDFTTYKSPNGDFSVKFPGEPTIQYKTESTCKGENYTTSYSVKPKFGIFGNKYVVFTTDFVLDKPNPDYYSVENTLKTLERQFEREGSKIESKRAITHGELEGWEFEFEAISPKRDVTAWLFVKGTKTYWIAIVRKPGKDVSEERKEFLESFELY